MKPVLGPRVTILGLGISGLESAKFLKKQGFDVFVSEKQKNADTARASIELRALKIDHEIGAHDFAKILNSDWVVTSPGIPPTHPLMESLFRTNVPVLSEIEAAYLFCKSKKIIAVTGTAGKTTTTTLLLRCLQKQGFRSLSCGNIGNPWIGELDRILPEDYVVMELSSFQLFYTQSFRPWIGLLLNISPNHLDWHGTLEHYVRSKLKIFANQGAGDYSVFCEADQKTFFPSFPISSKQTPFALSHSAESTRHAVEAVAKLLSIPMKTVDDVFREFQGIEHRLEIVAQKGGVTFVNDSKSTTPLSLAYALERYQDRQVVLLAGGRAKSKNFGDIGGLLKRKVRRAYVYGEAAELLDQSWKEYCPVHRVPGILEALQDLQKNVKSWDVVLLSPGCASFDQFKNYEERGHFFKAKVQALWAEAVLTEIR